MQAQMNFAPLVLAAAAGLLHPSTVRADDAQPKPNIIFFLFDDMGWSQPQSYNPDSKLRTPNLDKLASQGMRFTDAHSASAVCTPTRYGVLTGRYPSRIGQFGVLGTWSEAIIPGTRTTVASLLKRQGYETACVGKWHLGLGWENPSTRSPEIGAKIVDGPNQRGFDYFCGFTHAGGIKTVIEQDQVVAQVEPVESQPMMLRKGIAWLEERSSDKPFFLYFPVCPPHYPVAPSPEFIGKSGGVDVAGKDLKGQANPELYPDWVYQGDAMLGTIMDLLERKGWAKNTLLIATADNGAEHRVYEPLRESKRSIYEGGHRVPFVVRWSGKVKPGSTWEHTVCLNDLMATAAEITNAEVPASAGEDSVSILPALLGTTDSPTREGTIHQSMGRDLAIRQGPWKMIFHANGVHELFNLSDDLSEEKDVISENTEVAARLSELMQSYIDNGRSTPGEVQPIEFSLSLDGLAKSKPNKARGEK